MPLYLGLTGHIGNLNGNVVEGRPFRKGLIEGGLLLLLPPPPASDTEAIGCANPTHTQQSRETTADGGRSMVYPNRVAQQ